MRRIMAAACTLLILCGLCGIMPAFAASAAENTPSTHAAVLMEAGTGTVLEEKDGDVQLPVGTMAKLMTVWLTAEAVAEGKIAPETPVTAPQAAQEQKGAVIWLTAGEKMSVLDLLRGVIVGNAGDAAVTLAYRLAGSEEAFVRDMNAAAFSLGMRNTRFVDAAGNSPENISTAHDLGLLCCALLKVEWLTPVFTTWRSFLRDGATELVTENTAVRTVEGVLGLKAGHGEESGYTLALAAEQNGIRCVAVVLRCEDKNRRFTIGKKLLTRGFTGYSVTTPDFSAEFMQPLRVRHGTQQAVLLHADALRAVAAPNGAALSCTVVLPMYAEAPVRAGQTLGTAAFYCGDTLAFEIPLTAAESVPRRDFFAAWQTLVAKLF